MSGARAKRYGERPPCAFIVQFLAVWYVAGSSVRVLSAFQAGLLFSVEGSVTPMPEATAGASDLQPLPYWRLVPPVTTVLAVVVFNTPCCSRCIHSSRGIADRLLDVL